MYAVQRRARWLAMVSALIGMVATVAAPMLGDVSAGPRVPTTVESTLPDDGGATPETTVAATQPIPAEAPTTEPDTPDTTVGITTPPTTIAEPTTTDAPTAPAGEAPLPTVEPAPLPDTTLPETAVGPAGADDSYAVTVEATCGIGFHPAVRVVNGSTADVRVSVGHQSTVLGVGDQWLLDWPTIEGDPPISDPAPKWDAVRLDGVPPEVFAEGVLSLPADCPATDVPSAPRDLASTATDASVGLSWTAPESDGGSPITDYTIEHNAVPFEDDDWTRFDDGVGTGTSVTVAGLTNGETYLFRVRAVNAAGNAGVSADAKDTPNVSPSMPRAVAVGPTLVRGELRLSWGVPTQGFDIFLYEIERSLDNVTWSPLSEVGGDTTSYVDTGLLRTRRYHYRVTARNGAGQSPPSTVVNGVPNDVPSPPRSLGAAPTTLSGQVRLTWVAPLSNGGSPITDYIVQRSTNGTNWTVVNDGVNVQTAYVVTGLPNGTRFSFRVLAKSAVLGTSAESNVVNAIPRTIPTAPRSLTATATGVTGQVRLAWVSPASTGGSAVLDFILQRSLNGTNWTTVNDGVGTATSYTVTGLATGTRYSFRVLAKNAAGTGPASNVANAIPTYVLTAPRSLTATPTNRSGQIRLAWLAPSSNGGAAVSDYFIQRSPNGTSGWTTITDGVSVNTSYTVSGLSNGVRYYFRVLARTSRAWSPSSNVVNAISRTLPTAPRSLVAASNRLPGQIRLTWLAPASNGGSAITDYIVQRSTNGWANWTTVNDGISAATTSTVAGLTNGVRYYFRVFARNAAGTGPASPVVNAIPRAVPSQPAYLYVEASYFGFEFRWQPPASNGGSPVTAYVLQMWDYDTYTWFDLSPLISPTWRDAFLSAAGYGCGAFRIAAINAVGRGPYLGPLEVCYLPLSATRLDDGGAGKPATGRSLQPA